MLSTCTNDDRSRKKLLSLLHTAGFRRSPCFSDAFLIHNHSDSHLSHIQLKSSIVEFSCLTAPCTANFSSLNYAPLVLADGPFQASYHVCWLGNQKLCIVCLPVIGIPYTVATKSSTFQTELIFDDHHRMAMTSVCEQIALSYPRHARTQALDTQPWLETLAANLHRESSLRHFLTPKTLWRGIRCQLIYLAAPTQEDIASCSFYLRLKVDPQDEDWLCRIAQNSASLKMGPESCT